MRSAWSRPQSERGQAVAQLKAPAHAAGDVSLPADAAMPAAPQIRQHGRAPIAIQAWRAMNGRFGPGAWAFMACFVLFAALALAAAAPGRVANPAIALRAWVSLSALVGTAVAGNWRASPSAAGAG